MEDELARDALAMYAIQAEIEAGRIRLYRNLLRQPYMICDLPGYPAIHTHLLDQDLRAWLTHFVWKALKLLLHQREADRILQQLSGQSLRHFRNQVRDPALLQAIESEPLIAIVLEFMHTKDRHERSGESLWKELKAFGHDRELLKRGRKRFPGGTNVLSRQLKLSKDILALLDIDVEIRRSNGCIITLTRRSDASTNEPSTQPSPHNSTGEKDLLSKDDRLARLREKQVQPTQPEERNES